VNRRIILAIAGQTFTEARRNKVFYSLFFFALLVVVTSVLFTEVTIVTMDRVLKDTGIAAINVFALALTIFTGVGVINREVDRRSIYTVIVKPIPRYVFILGKYLGLLCIAIATSGAMFLGLLVVMALYQTPITTAVFAGYLGILLETAVIGAFAVLCSTFTSSFISAVLCVAVYLSGHMSSDLLWYANKAGSELVKAFCRGLYYVVPNLERFNFKVHVTYDLAIGSGDLFSMGAYGLTYVGSFLIAAVVVFSNRDFR
jgi:Cu-processing system permease protein